MSSPKGSFRAVRQYLFRPVDAASLVFFRLTFGAFLFLFVLFHRNFRYIEQFYGDSSFSFYYRGFSWVEPLPSDLMYLVLIGLGISSLLVLFGWFYRLGMVGSLILLTYFLFSEPTYYQNHVYLLILLSFLGIWLPLNRTCAVDGRNLTTDETVPRLALWLVQFQIGLVYFYGAVVKTNTDWFHCQPLLSGFPNLTDTAIVGPLLDSPEVIVVATYGILVFEYLVVPLLLWQRSRIYAFGALVGFHFFNASVWGLDVFPWFMITATTVFFSPDWPRRVGLMHMQPGGSSSPDLPDARISRNLLLLGTGLFVLWQLVFPFRHYLYEGHVGWNEFGRDFTWRMKLDHKKATPVKFTVRDVTTGKEYSVNAKENLTRSRYLKLERKPQFIYQYAQFLADRFSVNGRRPEVFVDYEVSFNGRPYQSLIDPDTDLARASLGWSVPDWVIPLNHEIPPAESCLRGFRSKPPLSERSILTERS